MQRVLTNLGHLADVVGLLGLQPLDENVEAALLAQAGETEESLRQLIRRGQEDGDFEVGVDPEWILSMLTWLTVAAADSVRLGRLTTDAAQRHLTTTITSTITRSAPSR